MKFATIIIDETIKVNDRKTNTKNLIVKKTIDALEIWFLQYSSTECKDVTLVRCKPCREYMLSV